MLKTVFLLYATIIIIDSKSITHIPNLTFHTIKYMINYYEKTKLLRTGVRKDIKI